MQKTQTAGLRPWVVLALLVVLALAGCGRRGALSGKSLKVEGRQATAIKQLIEKAVDLTREGNEGAVMSLLKKDLPKAGQAAVLNTLRKLAEAEGWEVQGVQRFGDAYFRATVELQGGSVDAVTVNVLEEGERYVLTGGG